MEFSSEAVHALWEPAAILEEDTIVTANAAFVKLFGLDGNRTSGWGLGELGLDSTHLPDLQACITRLLGQSDASDSLFVTTGELCICMQLTTVVSKGRPSLLLTVDPVMLALCGSRPGGGDRSRTCLGVSVIQDGKSVFEDVALVSFIRELNPLEAYAGAAETPLLHPADVERLEQQLSGSGAKLGQSAFTAVRIATGPESYVQVAAHVRRVRYGGRPALAVVLLQPVVSIQELEELKGLLDIAYLYLDILGHDLRNKLQTVVSATELIRHADNKIEEAYALGMIEMAVEGAESIITKTQATRDLMTAPMYRQNLVECIREAVKMVSEVSQDVITDMDIRVGRAEVVADKHLRYMLYNVLENALTHNTSGSKRVWVTLREQAGGYTVTIEDNGSGIPEYVKSALVSPDRRYGGVGLQLVMKLVRKYHGRIDIKNRTSDDHIEGTRVDIWLPAAPDDDCVALHACPKNVIRQNS